MKEGLEGLGHVLDHVANHTNTTGLGAGEIAGISVGAVVAAGALAALGLFCCRRMQRRAQYRNLQENKRGSASVDAEEGGKLTLSPTPTSTH